MNILEKLQESIKNYEGEITSKEQLELFATGYLQGICDQQQEDWHGMKKTEAEQVKIWVNNYFVKPFYFTFGSWEGYPFQDGYIIVKATDIREAANKFKEKYPNERDETVLNCSDYYGQEHWNRILERGYYVGKEPFVIIE